MFANLLTGSIRARPKARGMLAVWFLFTLLCLAIALSPWKSGYADAPDRGVGDVQLFRAEVDRIARGEGYYLAAANELRTRGYPTRSVFNWRTPLPMWLIGQLPHRTLGRILSGSLALLVLVLGFQLLEREGNLRQAVGGTILMFGALLPCVLDDIFIMPDVWAGLFIALSIAGYGHQRHGWGLACGLAALFLRDLAAPYCLLMVGLAVWQRRRGEAYGWLVGLVAYGLYFAWHANTVRTLILPNDLAHTGSWVQLGGLPFVLSTAQMNCFLLLLPQWVTALFLPLALLGFATWKSPTGQCIGLAATLYLALFAAVGHPFNQYWGQLVAVPLCFGFVRSFAALGELLELSGVTRKVWPEGAGPLPAAGNALGFRSRR